jgi:hypothetical protein
MNADHLIAIGFERCGGDLLAPAGTSVAVTPLDSRCLRLVVTLPNGAAVSLVTAAVALKAETAT